MQIDDSAAWRGEDDVGRRPAAEGRRRLRRPQRRLGTEFLDFHASPVPYGIHVQVLVNGKSRFAEKYTYSVYKREFPAVSLGTPVTLVDPTGRQFALAASAGKSQVAHACVKDLAGLKYPETGILVIGQNALAKLEKTELQTKLTEFTAAGGWVVCLEQEQFPTGCFPVNLRPDTTERSRRATMVQPIDAGHPTLEGISSEDFRYWRGDHYVTRLNLIKPTRAISARCWLTATPPRRRRTAPRWSRCFTAGAGTW